MSRSSETDVFFSRTPAGLANYPDFLSTDIVIFCEGEPASRTGVYQAFGPDEVFWAAMMGRRFRGKTIRTMPVGSKPEVIRRLRQLVRDKDAMDLGRVYGCADRDYDNATQDFDHSMAKLLFLTDGYSVENDLFSLVSRGRFCRALTPHLGAEARSVLEEKIQKLDALFTRLVVVDSASRECNLPLLGTDSIPSFIEGLRFSHDLTYQNLCGGFQSLKRARLASHGRCSISALARSKGISIRPHDRSIEGLKDYPGKSLLKILAEIANKLFGSSQRWSKINAKRILDFLLAEFNEVDQAGAPVPMNSSRHLSWANRS